MISMSENGQTPRRGVATKHLTMLEPEVCYRAMESRDRRFEGHFIIGVRTTRIYCRPGCPARIPRRSNVTFYPSAAAAERAGLRACRRCRPDASPASPAAAGTPATVTRALRLIDEGGLDGGSVEALAARLGMGARHLRRLFDQHLGASPIAVALSRRVHFARRLLDETDLPITDVAHAAGFASVRRFNDAMKIAFGAPPRELRGKRSGAPSSADRLTLTLAFRPPLAWDELLAFLAARAIPGVERVADGVYARTFAGGTLAVARAGERHLTLTLARRGEVDLFAVAGRVRRLFDLDADPIAIAAHLGSIAKIPGLRVPGAWDGFEMAVRAILGQQVTVKGATTLAGRLVERFGERLADPEGALTHRFPSAARLASADLASIGLPAARAASIRALAAAVAKGALDLSAPAGLEPMVEALTAIPGVGPWTAHYIAMRAGREPDAFPASDLVLRKHAAPAGAPPLAPRALEARAEAWRPWRAYAALQLWHRKDPA
jgi:AraC family transcriptional regulator of adaptative response / DNA-3-methyladenine glycosylase II